ncbi:MAG: SUF system NifU family Fe-S cluster assembly protein [Thermoanaerobaculia bacterium]|nr:SUF system NifU family Fe-S cluster assembly protein [Thermoanaerobaculia bacterium]
MADLDALYQEVILDHYKRPRNRGRLTPSDRESEGYNPLCGDRVALTIRLQEDETIGEVAFEGEGCAISTASASLLTEAVSGKTVGEAREISELFRELVTGEGDPLADPRLGKLAALVGVRDYPMRVKCATLAWHTLQAALEGRDEPVTTE